jgi:hypothetical protein
VGLNEAYRWSNGEAVAAAGMLIHIARPLDFMMVVDHAEFLGLVPINVGCAQLIKEQP